MVGGSWMRMEAIVFKKVNLMVEKRTYSIKNSVTFAKVNGPYGRFSNMASNLCLMVNDINIPSTEALYQACKYPLFPHFQKEILSQKSPMLAKQCSQKYERYIRQDWDNIKFQVMRWCLRLKLLQNWEVFSDVLMRTGDLPIVEYSTKDSLWGAMPDGRGNLEGVNALGRLLMELRAEINPDCPLQKVLPPNIDGFLLLGHEIGISYAPSLIIEDL